MEGKTVAHQEVGPDIFRKYLTTFFKHKYKAVIIFLAVLTAVTLHALSLPPVYEATSSLLIKFGREYIYRPEVGDTKNPTASFSPFDQEQAINSATSILTSRDLVEKVIKALGVKTIYPGLVKDPSLETDSLGPAVSIFSQNLFAVAIKKSSVIQVSFQHEDPQVAAKAVNLLVDLFREKHLQLYSDPKSSFLEAQSKTYGEKLKESENSLEFFKQKNQVYALDEQRSLLLKQRADLDSSLNSTQNQIDELRTKLSFLKAKIKDIPKTNTLNEQSSERDSMISQVKTQLLNLRMKEQELLQKYKESSALVANVRQEIASLQDFLKQQDENASTGNREEVNLVYQDLEKEIVRTEADLNAQLAKVSLLGKQLSQVNSATRSLDLREKELQTLKREMSVNEKNYLNYADKLEEARISEDMNRQKMANISVIELAVEPSVPIKPNRKLRVLLGVVLGGVAAVGFAFFSEYVSQGLSTPESAERRLRIPVLASLPYNKK